MRSFLIVALAGCGRLGFEAAESPPAPPGVDANGDSPAANDIVMPIAATGSCPAIAWTGTELGIAWRDGTKLWFAAVDAHGAPLRPAEPIAGPLDNLDCPAITWTGSAFAIAVSSGAINKGDIDVIAVSDTVGPIQNVVTDGGDSTSPRIVSTGNGAIVAWVDQTGTNFNVMTHALDAAGTPINAVQTISANNGSTPGLAFTGSFVAVAWAGGDSIRQRLVSPTNTVVLQETSFTAIDAVAPVAIAWTGSDLVLSWRTFIPDEFNVARYDTNGNKTLAPQVLAFDAVRSREIAWLGDSFAMVWVDMSSRVEYNFARLDGSATVLGHEAFDLPHADTDSRSSLVWTGERFLAVLDDNQGGITLRSFVR